MQFMKTQAIFFVCFENAEKYSLGLTTQYLNIKHIIIIYNQKMEKKNKNTKYKKQ